MNIKSAVLLILFFFALPIIAVHILYKATAVNSFFISEWQAGEILTYIGAFYAALGTVFLGIMSIIQNENLHKSNNNMQLILRNEEKLCEFKRTAQEIISSFDSNIVYYTLTSMYSAKMTNKNDLFVQLELARKKASESANKFELLKHFNLYGEYNCCGNDSYDFNKSERLKKYFIELEVFFQQYIDKYKSCIDIITKIIHEDSTDYKEIKEKLEKIKNDANYIAQEGTYELKSKFYNLIACYEHEMYKMINKILVREL